MRNVIGLALLACSTIAIGCGNPSMSTGCGDGMAGTGHGSPVPLDSQPNWMPLGLGDSIVSTIALDKKNASSIWVGLSAGGRLGGAWRSLDHGKNWSKMGGGLPDELATFVTISPVTGTLYANPGAKGVWHSTDGGETWAPSSTSATDPGGTNGIFCHPTKTTVWTVASQTGVFRSQDNGSSFVRMNNMGLPLNQFALGPLYHDGQRLYLGTASHGIYVSTDEGDTWTQAPSVNLPVMGPASEVVNIAGDPSKPGFLVVLTNGALFTSSDGAATFKRVDFGAHGPRYTGLFVDGAHALVSMDEASDGPGGLFESTNAGLTWQPLGPMGFAIAATNVGVDGVIYIGTIGKGLWALFK